MLALAYAVIVYVFFLASFVYSVLWLGDVPGLPTTIDGNPGPDALAVDLALLGLFAVQHSVMARPAFKRFWTRIVPPAVERATYVLFSSACLFAICLFWRSIPGTIWRLDGPAASAMWMLYALGWLIALASTFMINHFDLLGLRQAWLHFTQRPQQPVRFAERWLYRLVRHPLMLGFLIAFWAAPWMTVARLVFAALTTAYILVAVHFLEERDLRAALGETYVSYQRRVPMLLPIPRAVELQASERRHSAN